MKLNISGRTALVTGAASGIGFEAAHQLIGEGVTVVMTDHNADDVTAARERLDSEHDKTGVVAADVTSLADLSRMHRYVSENFGPIDILVNSAGITGATGSFHEIDDADWVHAVEVNLHGPVRLTREFLPTCEAADGGESSTWPRKTPRSRTRTNCRTARRRPVCLRSPRACPGPTLARAYSSIASLRRSSKRP